MQDSLSNLEKDILAVVGLFKVGYKDVQQRLHQQRGVLLGPLIVLKILVKLAQNGQLMMELGAAGEMRFWTQLEKRKQPEQQSQSA